MLGKPAADPPNLSCLQHERSEFSRTSAHGSPLCQQALASGQPRDMAGDGLAGFVGQLRGGDP